MKNEYILGINGLGISPSACIIKNGNLVAMAEEERFNRLKNSNGLMPSKAVKFCLQEAGINLNEVKFIAFAWDSNFYKYKIYRFILKKFFKNFFEIRTNTSHFLRFFQEILKYHPSNVKDKIREMLRSEGIHDDIPTIKFVPHHLAHAASSYYASSFQEARILVVDGSGENISTSIWKGKDKNIIPIKKEYIPNSLGWFYQTITEYLGFTPNSHEGKVMALAAYGRQNSDIEKKLEQLLQILPNGNYKFNSKYSYAGKNNQGNVFSEELVKLLGPYRKPYEEINQYHKDIAFHTQDLLEKAVLNIVEELSKKHGYSGNICIAGGVGLNCKMNGRILASNNVKNIFVPPFSSDIGTSYGAALLISSHKKNIQNSKISHAYWGPSFDDKYILSILEKHKISFTKPDSIAKATAQLLSENKIIGWFQGRMEIGARALGARSIIANPMDIKYRDFINIHIKSREVWRPFAASILEEYKDHYIKKPVDAPFMSIAFEVTDEAHSKIPAAIHIDNTTRPQFVKKCANHLYWEMIHEFGKLSGVYAILNTSFNLKEEPIVCTPEDALRTFYTSSLDAVVLGSFIITK